MENLRTVSRVIFEQVGIVGDERSPLDIISDLTNSCIYPSIRFLPIHEKQLKAYVLWRWKGKKSVKEVIGDDFRFTFGQVRK